MAIGHTHSPDDGRRGGLVSNAVGAARDAAGEYAGEEDRPLGSYVGAMTVYGVAVVAGAGLLRRRRVTLPERLSAADLALIAVATHKLTRTIAKDSVTSPLRAPFLRYQEPAGDGEVNEEVRVGGWGHGVGELLSCPFCLAQWVATAFVGGLVVAPRATRLVAGVFVTRTGSDLIQLAYAALEDKAG